METLLAIWAYIRAFWEGVDQALAWLGGLFAPLADLWRQGVLEIRSQAFLLWAQAAGGQGPESWYDPWLIWALFEFASPDFGFATLLILAAGVMRGFSGFGAGMTMSPALALIWGPTQGVAIGTFLNTVATLQLLPGALKHAQWREIVPIVFAAMLVAPFGVYVLLVVDPEIMRRVIAFVVLIGAIVLLVGVRYRGQPTLGVRFGVGATSGLLSGSVGAGGPPVVVYFLGGTSTSQQVRANMILIPNFIRISVLITFIATGVLLGEPLWRGILMYLPFALGTVVGAMLFSRAHEKLYRYVAVAFLFTVSIGALLA